MEIVVQKGDITKLTVDAIVNAANSYGIMGGGVAGAIRRAGGTAIQEEAVKQAPVPIGKAVKTTSGSLPCKAVIHAPTMVEPGERTNVENVRKATIAALKCADEAGFASVAVPGMGTGVGRVPEDHAAQSIVEAVRNFSPRNVKKVILIDIGDTMVDAFKRALAKSSHSK
jgi:O-acetyl-ADP-ribose deacetylase (regulator of RNase III)